MQKAKGQLSAVATAHNSSATWKNFISIDVEDHDVTCGPRSTANQGRSSEDEDDRETSEVLVEFH